MLLVYNKLASAEDNGVDLHNPLALTHPFLPCRPAYPEARRQYVTSQLGQLSLSSLRGR